MSTHSSGPGNEQAAGRFDQTRWSLIQRAEGDGSVARRALDELCTIYRYPIYCYVRRRGYSPADADDLVQKFFAGVIAGDLFGKADREVGKMRAFLVSCLKDHLASEHKRAAAQKRGGGLEHVSLDMIDDEKRFLAEPADERSPDVMIDIQIGLLLLRRAISSARNTWKQRGKTNLFDALSPFLVNRKMDERDTKCAAQKFGESEGNIRQNLHRMRLTFQSELIREVQETVSTAKDAEEELAAIRAVLRSSLQRC